MKDSRPLVTIVTSGAGSAMGGIGLVTASMAEVFAESATVDQWVHHHKRNAIVRWFGLLRQSTSVWARKPALIVYEHIDLARLQVMAPWLQHIPFVVILHGVEVWRPIEGMKRQALARASRVLAVSHWTAREARASNPWLPEITVTWLGVRPRTRRDVSRTSTFLMLGRMVSTERYKGHDQVLEAWPSIKRAIPEARLVIVGEGDDRARLEGRAREEGLADVCFTGFVTDARRNELIDTAGVLLFPSAGEGFGLVVVEAAHAGLPVIAFRQSVVAELFPDDGVTFVESQEARDIARTAIAVMADPGERIRRADLSATRARLFTLQAFGERLRHAITLRTLGA